MTVKRCPVCDRAECPARDREGETFGEYSSRITFADMDDCGSHAVDWYQRALAAEAERGAVLRILDGIEMTVDHVYESLDVNVDADPVGAALAVLQGRFELATVLGRLRAGAWRKGQGEP